MRRATIQRLVKSEIILVFDALFLLALNHFGGQLSRQLEGLAHDVAGLLMFIDPLGDDVSRSLQSLLYALHLALYKLFRALDG